MPPGWPWDDDRRPVVVKGIVADLVDWLGRVDPGAVAADPAGPFVANRTPVLDGQLGEVLTLGDLDDATIVRRRPATILHVGVEDGALRLTLGDRRVVLPPAVEPAVRRLLDGGLTGWATWPTCSTGPAGWSSPAASSGRACCGPPPRPAMAEPLGPRCAAESLARDEPQIGTASRVQRWFVVEQPGHGAPTRCTRAASTPRSARRWKTAPAATGSGSCWPGGPAIAVRRASGRCSWPTAAPSGAGWSG